MNTSACPGFGRKLLKIALAALFMLASRPRLVHAPLLDRAHRQQASVFPGIFIRSRG
jgi:hypothetical protein